MGFASVGFLLAGFVPVYIHNRKGVHSVKNLLQLSKMTKRFCLTGSA